MSQLNVNDEKALQCKADLDEVAKQMVVPAQDSAKLQKYWGKFLEQIDKDQYFMHIWKDSFLQNEMPEELKGEFVSIELHWSDSFNGHWDLMVRAKCIYVSDNANGKTFEEKREMFFTKTALTTQILNIILGSKNEKIDYKNKAEMEQLEKQIKEQKLIEKIIGRKFFIKNFGKVPIPTDPNNDYHRFMFKIY